MSSGAFAYDVFLSYSARDKPVVRALAERFKADGLRVWFDEWEIPPGGNIPHLLDRGLENSRILILCMSENAFGSDWAMLESQTFRFRDPLNKDLRFIPLCLDGTEPKGSLAQFRYVDWQEGKRDEEYAKLVAACQGLRRDSAASFVPQRNIAAVSDAGKEQSTKRIISLGHADWVRSVAFSPDGRRALSGSEDYTVRLWDVESGGCVRVFEGHAGGVNCVAWSPDGRRTVSGSADYSLRLWDVETGACIRVLEGHTGSVASVAFSSDGAAQFLAPLTTA